MTYEGRFSVINVNKKIYNKMFLIKYITSLTITYTDNMGETTSE